MSIMDVRAWKRSRAGSPSPRAAFAIAHAQANPQVASVLFGATSPEQVGQNAQALTALEQLSDSVLQELRGSVS